MEFDNGSTRTAALESHGKREKKQEAYSKATKCGNFQYSFSTKHDGHTDQMSVMEVTCVTLGF